MLKQEPREIITDPRAYMHFIIGAPGTGKTTFAHEIPGHYFCFTEAGDPGLRTYGDAVITWTAFVDMCKELQKGVLSDWEGQRPISTFIIDNIESLFDLCGEHICKTQTFLIKGKQERFERWTEVPWGAGYNRVANTIVRILQKIRALGIGLVLISHSKERIVQVQGQDVTHFGPNLSGTGAEAMIALADVVGFFTIGQQVQRDDEGKAIGYAERRIAVWQPRFGYPTKHRLQGFPETQVLRLNTMWKDYTELFTQTAEKILAQVPDNY